VLDTASFFAAFCPGAVAAAGCEAACDSSFTTNFLTGMSGG
jgi:hypothetical protein